MAKMLVMKINNPDPITSRMMLSEKKSALKKFMREVYINLVLYINFKQVA